MKTRVLLNIFFLISLTFCAVWRVYEVWSVTAANETEGKVAGLVTSHPYVKDLFQTFEVDGVTVKTAVFPVYKMGDYLLVDGESSRNRSLYSKKNFVYYPKVLKVEDESNFLLQKISDFRDIIIRRTQMSLSEPYASLMLGMTIGYKEDFPEDILDILKRTGTSHIIVVSGYNVSLVMIMCEFILSFIIGKKFFLLRNLIFVLLFAAIAGFDPPVIRAVVMGSINVFALVSGQYRQSLYILFLAGLGLIILNPQYFFDISFQLSFVATTAVILVSDAASFLNRVFVGIMVLIAVNLFLYPILSYYFERISLLSLIANPLVLWIIPFITVLGFLFIIAPIFPFEVLMVSMIDYYLFISEYLSNLPFGVIKYRFNLTSGIIYYTLLLLSLRFLHLFKKNYNYTLRT